MLGICLIRRLDKGDASLHSNRRLIEWFRNIREYLKGNSHTALSKASLRQDAVAAGPRYKGCGFIDDGKFSMQVKRNAACVSTALTNTAV
jgi:hypothetical protein